MEIARRMAALRGERGWSQKRLAQVAGVNTGTITTIECGRAPNVVTLGKICRALEIQPGVLLDEVPPPFLAEIVRRPAQPFRLVGSGYDR